MSGYYEPADEAAEQFFRRAAKTEGLPYRVWCKQYGIVDAAALHRIEDNEVSLEAWQDDKTISRFVSAEERFDAYKRQSGGLASSGVCKGPGSAAIDPVTDNDAA